MIISYESLPLELKTEMEKVGVKVHLSRGFQLTIPVVQDPERQKLLDGLVELLEDYYIIEDKFTDHRERRNWRNQMEGRFGNVFNNFYDKNKLRGSWRNIILQSIETLGDVDKVKSWKPPILMRVREYDALSLAQKMDYVHQTEDNIARYLLEYVMPQAHS